MIGPQLALAPVGLALVAGLVLLAMRRSWLTPWLVIPALCLSAELQLRLGGTAGVLKDVVVLAVVLGTGLRVLGDPTLLRRLRSFAAPLLALGVVVGLYILNPVGSHGLNWVLSLRLVLEGVGLLLVAQLVDRPDRARHHLVVSVATMATFEAIFAWVQHAVGQDALISQWGYQFGAQVRQTSSGGLRASGTFPDPFALTALAVVALCLGLFVARRRLAVVLIVAAVVIVAATSVRTAVIQMGILFLVWVLHRGWVVQAAAAAAAGLASVLLLGVLITTAAYPGAPERPLILGFNGRSAQWLVAIQGPGSLVIGNGVAEVGAGSDRSDQGLVTQAAGADGTQTAQLDPSTFLDSAYAQVQSDVGVVGSLALLFWLFGTLALALRTVLAGGRLASGIGAGGVGLLLGAAVDWFGRTTLFAVPTGFLYLFVLGLLFCDLPTSTSRPAATIARGAAEPDQDDLRARKGQPAPVLDHRSARVAPPPRRLTPSEAATR